MKTIGNYRLLKKLGEGGMGTVFLGEDLTSATKVAIKLIKSDIADSESMFARFRHEIDVSKQFAHPFVIKILDGGFINREGLLYLAMEFLEGESLGDALSERDFSNKESWYVMSHMAEALSYIHEHGVIHRDIKPDNILLVSHERTVLLDFGLALMDAQTRLSQTSDRPGTWLTMSPEQMAGKTLDGRSDIYSLGITMYWALTGKGPYQRDDIVTIYAGEAPEAPLAPHIRNPQIDKTLSDIIMKSMSLNIEERFQSADDLVRSLKAKDANLIPLKTKRSSSRQLASSANKGDDPEGQASSTRRSSSSRKSPSSRGSSSMKSASPMKRPSSMRKASSKNRAPIGQSAPRSASKSNKTLIGGFATCFLILLSIILFTHFFRNEEQIVVFESKVISVAPFSAEIKTSTPMKNLSAIKFWMDGQSEKTEVGFKEDMGNDDWRMGRPFITELDNLEPGSKYYYILIGKDLKTSLPKTFNTSKFINSFSVLETSATDVRVNLKSNYSGKATLVLEAFAIENNHAQTMAFSSNEYSIDFQDKGEEILILQGLRPTTEYSIALSLKENKDSTGAHLPGRAHCLTKSIGQDKCYSVTRNKVNDDIIGNFLPAASKSWQDGVGTNGAKNLAHGNIVFSCNNFGLYLYNPVKRTVVREISTPGKQNLSLKISGDKVYSIESNFYGNESRAINTKDKNSSGYLNEGDEAKVTKEQKLEASIKIYDSSSLKTLKSIALPEDNGCETLLIHKDLAFVWTRPQSGKRGGPLNCYSLTSGKLLWKTAVTSDTYNYISPSGTLWIKDYQHTYHAYDCSTGKELFTVPVKGRRSCAPVEVGNLTALFLSTGEIKIVNRLSGELKQTIQAGKEIKRTFKKGLKVFCVTRGIRKADFRAKKNVKGRILGLDFSDPEKVTEEFTIRAPKFYNPVADCELKNSYLYYPDSVEGICCFDLKNRNFLYRMVVIPRMAFNIFPDETGLTYCQTASIIYHINDRLKP